MIQQKSKIECKNVSIEFPGVKALKNVDFEVETGHVSALVGANGAGKSTLMKVLSGANPTYTGEIFFDGKPVDIRNPNAAKKLGIEIVYQEVDTALFPASSVAENIMMNKLINGMQHKAFVNWKTIRDEAQKVIDRLHINVKPDMLVSNLSLAQKQMVLIARAVREQCKFLILDEPTAPLSMAETEELFKIVRSLEKEEGIGVIFISHRLNEILEICQTITVMRNGEIIENLPVTDELTIQDIVTRMLGVQYNDNFPKSQSHPGDVLFEAKHISDKSMLHDVTISVRKGEIVGITGLVGAGKTELCKAIFGASKITQGELVLDGKKIKNNTPTQAVKNKIGLVPEERRKEGVMVSAPVYFNLSSASLQRFTQCGFIQKKKEMQNAETLVKDLKIKTPTLVQTVAHLSGGNQQKVSVGKWLSADCELYIFDEPTKGIDVGAKREIFRLIQNIADEGKGVIYATSETSEILSITNRIYVMYNGAVSAELKTEDATEELIMYYATGGSENGEK